MSVKGCKRRKTYTAVSTVCAPPLFWGLVDLDVLDDQISGVETFGVGVGFGIFEKAKEEFGGFFGPAGFGDAELFTCLVETFISDVLNNQSCNS